jgi:hypothetical protein
MGGIIGEGGYLFQDAYIVCKIPDLISDSSFVRIFKEGSSDVDIEFLNNGKSSRYYTQLKNHIVDQGELREVLTQFKEKDTSSPNTFDRFILGCTGLHPEVARLKKSLDRLRGANDFYSAETAVLGDTEKDYGEILGILKIASDGDFIRNRVYFEDNLGSLTGADQTIKLFCGGMCNSPLYQDKLAAFRHVFHPLHTYISGSAGKTINRKELEDKISLLIEEYIKELQENQTSYTILLLRSVIAFLPMTSNLFLLIQRKLN